MKMKTPENTISFILILVLIVQQAESQAYSYRNNNQPESNVMCIQCNMRQRGIMNTCEEPAQRHNCTGCMKTMTKIKLKDSGTITDKPRISQVVSKYCMRHGSANRKAEGCYRHQNNGGYTVQCFCYTDNCNSLAPLTTHPVSGYMVTLLTVVAVILTTGTARLSTY